MFKDIMAVNFTAGAIVFILGILSMILAVSERKSFLKQYEILSPIGAVLLVLTFPREGTIATIVIALSALAFVAKVFFLYGKYHKCQKKSYTSNILMFDLVLYVLASMIMLFKETARLLG